MTDDAKPAEELTNAQLSDRIKEINDEKGTSFRVSGNKDELLASLAEAEAYTPSDDSEGADAADKDSDAGDGNVEAAGAGVDAQPSPESLGAAKLGVMTGPDGMPLPQANPEPADVAGPQQATGDGPDTTAEAAHNWQAAQDAAALEVLAERGTEVDEPYVMDDGELADGDSDDSQAARDRLVERGAAYDLDDSDYDSWADYAEAIRQATPQSGLTESTVPAVSTQQANMRAYVEANPDATLIPPPLLPPAYQDGTIATPGLPPL